MAHWYQQGMAVQSIAIQDRGLQYADGLFETIAVRDGRARFLDLHLDRLSAGCRRLSIELPGDLKVENDIADALSRSGQENADCLVKLIVTRGQGERGYAPPRSATPTILIGVFDRKVVADSVYTAGIRVRICNTRLGLQPQTAGIKLLARTEQVLARCEWQDPAIIEGLMLDQHGLLICGTMSNLFIVDRGRLRTPELTGCGVNGIMRRLILATAEQQNIDFEICRLTPEMAMGASEMFLCNSQVGIWPVARCESSRFDDWPLTTRLRQILRASGVREGPQ